MNLLLKIAFISVSTLAIANWAKKPEAALTPIAAIYEHTEYQDSQVMVFGKVKNKMTAFGKTIFWLEDESGKSVMIRDSKKNPSNGEYIYVTGIVHFVFDLGRIQMIELVIDP
jgi:hypothetical protein